MGAQSLFYESGLRSVGVLYVDNILLNGNDVGMLLSMNT